MRRWVAAPLAAVGLVVLGFGFTASPLFDVRSVVVTGAVHLQTAQVVRDAGLDRPANVYWFRKSDARRGLDANPWIASAAITRELPHTVRIDVVERRAASRVLVGSRWLLVEPDGTVLGPGGRHRPLPELPATTALTVGERSDRLLLPASVAARMTPWLRARVRSILSQHGEEVVLELTHGGRVALGRPTDLDAKVNALSGILRWAGRHHRLLEYVDLRAPLAPAARLVGAAGG